MKKPWVALVSVLLALSFALAGRGPLAVMPAPSWDGFVNHFIEAYFVAHPDFAVDAGRHELDGKLPDWSPAALSKEAERLRSARRRALQLDPASLDERERFEHAYLVSVIDRDLFWLEAAQWPYKNPMFYSRALDPNVYVTREYAPLKERLRAYIAYAKTVPAAVEHIRNNLRTPLPRTYIEAGKIVFVGLASYYEKDIPAVSYSSGRESHAGAGRVVRSATRQSHRELRFRP